MFENIGPAFTNDQQRAGLTVFSPQLRQEAYEARTQEYLRTIENLIGLKRGLLSDAQEVEKTAFEIASTAGDYNLSLQDLQGVCCLLYTSTRRAAHCTSSMSSPAASAITLKRPNWSLTASRRVKT